MGGYLDTPLCYLLGALTRGSREIRCVRRRNCEAESSHGGRWKETGGSCEGDEGEVPTGDSNLGEGVRGKGGGLCECINQDEEFEERLHEGRGSRDCCGRLSPAMRCTSMYLFSR